jgi:hypothetical protein
MVLRLVHTVLVGANCLFGLLLLGLYGPTLLHTRAWPPNLEQESLLLVAASVLPLAVMAARFPLVAGIAQFSTAYIGNQLLHDAPLPDLRFFSSVSMVLALVILAVALFRGIFEITQEAFGHPEDPKENQQQRRATDAA